MGHRLGSSLRLDMTVFGERRLGREAAMGKPVPFLQSDRAVEVCSSASALWPEPQLSACLDPPAVSLLASAAYLSELTFFSPVPWQGRWASSPATLRCCAWSKGNFTSPTRSGRVPSMLSLTIMIVLLTRTWLVGLFQVSARGGNWAELSWGWAREKRSIWNALS